LVGIENENFKVGGYLSGYVGVFRALKRPIVEADILVGQINLNQNVIGDLYFKSNYVIDEEELLIDAFLERGRKRLFTLLGGRIWPSDKKRQMDLPILLDKFPLTTFELFTSPDFKELQGVLSGVIQVQGTFANPAIDGRIRTEEASGYMPVIGGKFKFYFPDGAYINLSNSDITFPTIALTDILGNKAFLSGSIKHSSFSNMKFDFTLDSKEGDFIFYNPTSRESPEFYGTAIAKGKIFLSGSSSDINVHARITTSRGTRLYLSLEEGTLVATENSFVTFKSSRSDSIRILKKKSETEKEITSTTISLNIEASINPDAEINLIFNELTNDIMTASGQGNLRLELTPAGDLFVFGDYQVVKGKYLFSMQNLVSKELMFKPGGVLTFTGDPTVAKIDATAFYATRTSPAPLLAATSLTEAERSSARNRIPVEVLVKLKGPIMEPLIEFDVDFPTLPDNTKAAYQTVLNSADEKNKQAFTLLVLNQFLAPGTLGSSLGGGGALGANSLEVISNQLSNLISKISDDVDLGVRYRQGSKTGSGANEVELALSTRLLDDRLIIDGNFGFVTNNPNSNSASTVNSQNSGSIIDINIEYLLTRDGRLRLRAFNRSNYANLFSPFPYTQGAGLGFQTQFNTWKELINRKRKLIPAYPLIFDDTRPED